MTVKLSDFALTQPMLSYRWQVLFTSSMEADFDLSKSPLTSRVTDVKLDYMNKEIALSIEQSMDGFEHDEIYHHIGTRIHSDLEMPWWKSNIRLDALDGNERTLYSVVLTGLRVKKHEFALSYGEGSKAAAHVLVLAFTGLRTMNPAKPVQETETKEAA